MKIGYARVSSLGQSLDTQIEKLSAFGCEKIFQEKKSGDSTGKREAVKDALEFGRESAKIPMFYRLLSILASTSIRLMTPVTHH